jgi:serine/threonine protein phosphatase PrpC
MTNEQQQNLVYFIATQEGYKLDADGETRIPIHEDNEDFSIPLPTESVVETTDESTIFIIADGHGGSECAEFLTMRAELLVRKLVESKDWDLSKEDEFESLRESLLGIYADLDEEYCKEKAKEMREAKGNGCFGNKTSSVVDDGSTLCINIILKTSHGRWIINCNVGDSRTIIAPLSKDSIDSDLTFASVDDNMRNVERINHLLANGGRILNTVSLTFVDQKYLAGESLPSEILANDPLAFARVYRQGSKETRDVGVSYKRTLNLTSSMGDLLYKVKPAVMSWSVIYSLNT